MSANGKRVALVEILAREITFPYLAAGVLDDTTMRATTDLGRAAARRVLDKLGLLAPSEAGVQGGEDDERRAGPATRAALVPDSQGEADAASAKTPAPSRYSMIFDRLERYTPEQRAEVFHHAETRWCWDCGREQGECPGHGATPLAED